MSSSVATNSPAQDTNAAAASGASPSNPNVLSTDINTSSSLYVGDLLPTVTEAILFEIFNPVAPVTNIKVCRDSSTRVSLGYAYVNFQTHADAERVMESMNYIPIKGKPCRISWPIRDANVRKNTAGNVFIKNLDPTIDDRALYDTFSLFGRILSCKVVKDEKGESKGYGFVHFESPQAAESAIEKINGMLISGREVYVGHFMKHEERTQHSQFTNIYVKNVPMHWDDKRFSDLFSECGEIKSAALSKGADNKSKGFGFIDFAEHEAAVKAIEKFNDFEVKTKEGEEKSGAADKSDVIPSADQTKLTQKLVVCRAQKKSERSRELQVKFEQAKKEMIAKYQGVNLFVKDLHESVDDAELREMFKEFGSITSARVMKDEPTQGENGAETQGKSRGFGFVCFTTPEEATKAVTEMNGKELKGKKIYVALAQRKEIRQAMLLAQNAGRGALNMGMAPQGIFPGAQMFFPNQARGANPAFPYMQQPMLARGMMNNVAMMQGRGMMPMQGRGQPGFGMQQGFGMQGGMGRVHMQNGPRGPRGGPRTGGNFGGPNQGRGNMRGGQPMMQGGQPMMMQGRGMPQPMMMGMAPQQQPQQIQAPIPVAPLTAAALANASDEEQKNMIGERLFPLVSEISPELAGKITGMLLEMENPELLHLLESPASLRTKVDEAIKILQTHTQ